MPIAASLRERLRASRRSKNPLVRSVAAALHRAREWFRAARAFLTDAEFRSIAVLRLRHRRDVHQTTALTAMDRYPGIFSACRELLGDAPALRLLSFGCSTGEEVVTLRRYFPRASIVGAELNARSLAVCRARVVDDRISFVRSGPRALAAHAPYDAIFCMAVLQRTPHAVEAEGVESLRELYPFERFETQVRALDALLAPGGLLVIHHTQYRFHDTSVAPRYTLVHAPGAEADRGPLFDRRSRLVPGAPHAGSIWRKEHA